MQLLIEKTLLNLSEIKKFGCQNEILKLQKVSRFNFLLNQIDFCQSQTSSVVLNRYILRLLSQYRNSLNRPKQTKYQVSD